MVWLLHFVYGVVVFFFFFALMPHCRICLALTRVMMVCMGRDHLVYIAVMAAGLTSSKVCSGAGYWPADHPFSNCQWHYHLSCWSQALCFLNMDREKACVCIVDRWMFMSCHQQNLSRINTCCSIWEGKYIRIQSIYDWL